MTGREIETLCHMFKSGLRAAIEGRPPFDFSTPDLQGPRPSLAGQETYNYAYQLGVRLVEESK